MSTAKTGDGMMNSNVEQLAQLRGAPAVSILCPLDTLRPGNPPDPGVLRELRDRAAALVRGAVSGSAASTLISRIDDAISAVDLAHPTPGVALFVSSDVTHIISLDSPVEPQVVVGERFASLGVLAALARRRRARVVVLSQTVTRCIDLTGGNTYERLDFGFPVEIQPPVETDAPHRDFPLDEHEHAEAAKYVFRSVDRALEALQHHDRRPLVLLGAERDLAYFDEITGQRANVIGRLHGDYERDTAAAIADLVQQVLDAHELEQQAHACAQVREVIGTRAVAGIADVWSAARAGRGHQLLVENDFSYSARSAGDTLEPAPREDADAFDAVEDTVEEVVRHGGEVVVVRSDSLRDLDRIALVTRY
jgi:hypothetical protein